LYSSSVKGGQGRLYTCKEGYEKAEQKSRERFEGAGFEDESAVPVSQGMPVASCSCKEQGTILSRALEGESPY
jgi:hypothetical protein